MKVVKVADKYKQMTDPELKEFIRLKLGEDPKWARRALLALYDEQSPEEQEDPTNVHVSNGRGFSPADQEFLTSLAKQAQQASISFSQKQLGWLYRLLPKYAGQMVKIIRELEKMEPSFVLKLYFAQVAISNTRKEMTALTGELGLDPRFMPEAVSVSNPSGSQVDYFSRSEVLTLNGKPDTFVYKGFVDKEEWVLMITVGEPDPLPEWVNEMEKMMKGPRK